MGQGAGWSTDGARRQPRLEGAVQGTLSAVDGLAADILPEHEIERVNGVMFGGQMAGIAVGTGLGGTLIA